MPALGEEFRNAREARGLTVSDVAEQIHIRSVYLAAIENEEWTSIGAPVYVRGFIRTYARFLGLDGEDAVARFSATLPLERSAPSSTPAMPVDRRAGAEPRQGPSPWTLAGGLVALLLVAFVGYEYWQYSHVGAGSAVALATAPAQSPSGGVAANATSPASPKPSPRRVTRRRLAVRLTQRSWLRVSVDGAVRLDGIYPAGTARTFAGSVAFVRAGNAGGVLVGVNGKRPAPIGKIGDVVEHRYTL